MPPPFMDTRSAPFNPCSVETIPEPVRLADGRHVWPLMLCCYQLGQETGDRVGFADLSFIDVPDIPNHASAMPLKFDKSPYRILEPESSSGILDGKWSAIPTASRNSKTWCFATAHSSGEIRLHSFTFANSVNEKTSDTGYVADQAHLPTVAEHTLQERDAIFSDANVSAHFMGQSRSVESSDLTPGPLCLSLSWDNPAAYKHQRHVDFEHNNSNMPRIVSTYSNGTMAIHDVAFGTDHRRAQLIQRDSWDAHSMFTNPAEVWSACFAGRDVVLSGGDEGKLKVWDVRATTRPMQVLDEPFDAGVTCLSPHPTQEHIVAVGSYDESISLFDMRFLSQRTPMFKTDHLGGGIWRMKWHPYDQNRMLVAAMHAGCRVLNFYGGPDGSDDPFSADNSDTPKPVTDKCTKAFTEHESMAYGADWLVCQHPTQNGYFEAAASCSFYDRAVFLWDSVH